TAQIDLDSGKGAQVYRLLKGKRINQMSFAYDVLEGSQVTKQSDNGEPTQVYELRKLRLHEVSVVPIGANDQTEILAVKAAHRLAARQRADGAAGRSTDPALYEAMKSARDALDHAIESSEPEQASADGPPEPGTPDEDTGAKASPTVRVS